MVFLLDTFEENLWDAVEAAPAKQMDEELNDSDISLDDSIHSGENDELVNLLDVPYTSTEPREEDSLEYEVNPKNFFAFS
ncbi:unnamed protein product [Trichobilharzia regenti]|nr:unnamed protein product [Trichobilharzia regenti]